MAHVVTKNCYECRYTDCVVVCPVECFYADDKMLYIDPEECIDCEACVSECPVDAIFLDINVPRDQKEFIKLNEEQAAILKDNDGHISDKEKPKKADECVSVIKEKEKAEAARKKLEATQALDLGGSVPTRPATEGQSSPSSGAPGKTDTPDRG